MLGKLLFTEPYKFWTKLTYSDEMFDLYYLKGSSWIVYLEQNQHTNFKPKKSISNKLKFFINVGDGIAMWNCKI